MVVSNAALEPLSRETDDSASLSWRYLEDISIICRDIPSPRLSLLVRTESTSQGNGCVLTAATYLTNPD
jgi:hypothetical protein